MPVPAIVALALSIATVAGAQDVEVRTLVDGASFPTNLAPAPDGSVYYTEKETGRVRVIDPRGRLRPSPVAELAVSGGAERGLLGIALAPDGRDVYLYLSDATDGRNRVVRLPVEGGAPRTVFDGLPSVTGYHNGGDLAFGPDGALYVVTGEAHDPDLAQDPASVGGKLLRLDPDGAVPADNPDPSSPVYASGIRNSFGICIDPASGQVWETENGPDRDDEINRVPPGANLGWPVHLGRGGEPRFVDPVLVYPDVIVPTGCAIGPDGALYFGDFTGDLHRVTIDDGRARDAILAQLPSGITDVAVANDGGLLIATADAIVEVVPGDRAEDAPGEDQRTPATDPILPGAARPAEPSQGFPWVRIAAATTLAIVAVLILAVRRRRPR